MSWLIPASSYQLWPDFRLEFFRDIVLENGNCYHLQGNNGAGKTTFLKQLLIPMLERDPSRQYVLYIEQQVQSQLDAILAYAALNRYLLPIRTAEDMLDYLLELLHCQLQKSTRPVILILDESIIPGILQKRMAELDQSSICLLYTSHQEVEIAGNLNLKQLRFDVISPQLTRLEA